MDNKTENGGRTCSKLLAYGTLLFDAAATCCCMLLCALAILRSFSGALPFLTALVAFLQAMTGAVLNGYFSKSKAENTAGGIVYETALARESRSEKSI